MGLLLARTDSSKSFTVFVSAAPPTPVGQA